MRCYTKQFFVQLVSHFCCDASCAKNCHVSNLLPQALQKVELNFTYRNDCSNDFIDFLALRSVTPNVTPRATVLQCFAWSAIQDSYYPLLGPPRSQFLRAVPLHSVMHLSICNINIPLPRGHTPGHLNFFLFSGQIPLTRVRNTVQMPHM